MGLHLLSLIIAQRPPPPSTTALYLDLKRHHQTVCDHSKVGPLSVAVYGVILLNGGDVHLEYVVPWGEGG